MNIYAHAERFFMTTAAAALTAMVGIGMYWTFDTYIPFKELGAQIVNAPRVVAQLPAYYYGEQLITERNRCIFKQPEIVKRFISDSLIYQLPLSGWYGTVNDCRIERFSITIPKGLPPGEYNYNVVVEFRINPIKFVDIPLEPLSFRILGETPPSGP